jgi:hypothetical protein
MAFKLVDSQKPNSYINILNFLLALLHLRYNYSQEDSHTLQHIVQICAAHILRHTATRFSTSSTALPLITHHTQDTENSRNHKNTQ